MSNILKEEKNHLENSNSKRQKIIRKTLEAADGLSLGISMVVAVFIGVGIGYLLKIYSLSLAFLAWSFLGDQCCYT